MSLGVMRHIKWRMLSEFEKQKFGFNIEDKIKLLEVSQIFDTQAHVKKLTGWGWINQYQPVLTSINHREASNNQLIGHQSTKHSLRREELKKADLESHLARRPLGGCLILFLCTAEILGQTLNRVTSQKQLVDQPPEILAALARFWAT